MKRITKAVFGVGRPYGLNIRCADIYLGGHKSLRRKQLSLALYGGDLQ